MKKGKPVADTSKRDTESVPLDEDVDAYFAREVLPYRPGAWIDKSKTKVGYEIPFTRTFYEYEELEPAADIAKRIAAREKVLACPHLVSTCNPGQGKKQQSSGKESVVFELRQNQT